MPSLPGCRKRKKQKKSVISGGSFQLHLVSESPNDNIEEKRYYLKLNAVKCNLTELTTKSACVPLEVSGVDTYADMSEFHVLVDCSIAYVAYVQEAFSCIP